MRDWLRDVAGKNRELFKELLQLAKEEGCLQVDESGLSHVDELFRFLEDPGIDYSTNRAERMIKVYAELRGGCPMLEEP